MQHDRNPIESMKSRLKSPSSIMNKMQKRGLSLDFPTMQANIMDIAGVRVICSFEEDVFFLAKCLKEQSDIEIITEKDYISHPKPNGYRSLHLTIRLPVFFAEKEIHVPVEIQLRTIAMDFWASLEHTIRYKKNLPINTEIETELKECADSSREWDSKMEHLLHILTMIISCKHPNPQFEGQTKGRLGNSEVRKLADSVFSQGFERFLLEHPEDAKIIVNKALLACRARNAARKAREITRKTDLSTTNFFGKLSDCKSKDPKVSEIFIVEGDSAGEIGRAHV